MPGKDIDEIFRQGLNDLKPAYKRSHWERLQSNLENSPSELRRRMRYRIAYSAAAILVLALSVYLWQSSSFSGKNNLPSAASTSKVFSAQPPMANAHIMESGSSLTNSSNNMASISGLSGKNDITNSTVNGKSQNTVKHTRNSSLYSSSALNNGNSGGNNVVGNNSINIGGPADFKNSASDNSKNSTPADATNTATTSNAAMNLAANSSVTQEQIHPFPAIGAAENISPVGQLPVAGDKKAAMDAGSWTGINYHFWQNPAYTGEDQQGKLSVNLDDRREYIDQSPNSSAMDFISGEYQVSKGNNIGAWYGHDLTTYEVQSTGGVAFSHKMILGENTSLSMGVSGTFNNNIFASGTTAISGDAGLWLTHKNFYASFVAQNVNQPSVGFIEGVNEVLAREYQTTAGYVFHLPADFSIMPRFELDNTHMSFTGQSQLIAAWKGKIMLGVGENNLSLSTKGANYSTAYVGVQIKRVRIFTSYGRDDELEYLGLAHKNIIESGMKISLF